MKILRIIPSMNPAKGGPSQGIRNSIPELIKMGVDNQVVCLDDPSANFLGKDPFVVYALGPAKDLWAYQANLKPWLLNNIPHYDAIIIHGLWQYHSFATIHTLIKLRKFHDVNVPRVYVMPHGMLDPYFQKAKGRKLKAWRNWLYWKFIEGKVVNHADGVLFTTQEELELARTTFRPYRPKKELCIGYGITPPPHLHNNMITAFSSSAPNLAGKPYLLFLSRIHEKKGVDLLLKAYLYLKSQALILPDLVIAGPGLETTYGRSMLALASGQPCIHFTGMLTGEAKWGALYGCQAFILPSHQENFGIAVVEALVCEKPVLISNQVNIWREIDQEGAGIIAEDTLEGVVEMLTSWIAKTNEEKADMGKRAKKTYQTYFTIEQAASRMAAALMQY